MTARERSLAGDLVARARLEREAAAHPATRRRRSTARSLIECPAHRGVRVAVDETGRIVGLCHRCCGDAALALQRLARRTPVGAAL